MGTTTVAVESHHAEHLLEARIETTFDQVPDFVEEPDVYWCQVVEWHLNGDPRQRNSGRWRGRGDGLCLLVNSIAHICGG